jgi:ABC-type enterobactin transport system permease subunit
MRTIKSLSRLGVVLASLAVVAVSLASSASASTTMIPVGGSGDATVTDTGPVTVVHTVVVGGMPGWQIALIAVVAALVTAVAAVLVERTRMARRRPVRPMA